MFTLGSFAIIFDDQKRVLLCHRRDMDAWNLPGGGVEMGELPNEAAIRETKEETGLDVSIERFVGVYAKIERDEIVFVFVCRPVGGELTLTDEADGCEYFEIGEIPANTSPKHVERIQDAMEPGRMPVFRRQTAVTTKEMLRQLKK